MQRETVNNYIITNQKYFPEEKIAVISEKLTGVDDNKLISVCSTKLNDPSSILLISFFAGTLGIDRFMIGDIGMGILKLLTLGCCGILTIIDWFTISKRVKEKNFLNISSTI